MQILIDGIEHVLVPKNEIVGKSVKLNSEVENKFDEGWWNCFCSFANELANVSSSASMVIRNVLDGAGVTKKEITENLKTQHFDKRVVDELVEYKAKL